MNADLSLSYYEWISAIVFDVHLNNVPLPRFDVARINMMNLEKDDCNGKAKIH